MWKKSLYFLFLFLAAEWLVSCWNCEERHPEYVGHSMCVLEVMPLDNSGAYPLVADTLHVPRNAFGIRLRLDVKKGLCTNPAKMRSLFNESYALTIDCPPDLIMSTYPDSLKIITQNDLNADYPAGSDVSELFLVLNRGSLFPTIQALRQESGPYIRNSISNGEIVLNALLYAEPFAGPQQFVVQLYLKNMEPMIEMTPTLNFE